MLFCQNTSKTGNNAIKMSQVFHDIARRECFTDLKKVLQLNCKTQLMERDALNQQHVTQCYAIALIKSRRSLLVVGKTTG